MASGRRGVGQQCEGEEMKLENSLSMLPDFASDCKTCERIGPCLVSVLNLLRCVVHTLQSGRRATEKQGHARLYKPPDDHEVGDGWRPRAPRKKANPAHVAFIVSACTSNTPPLLRAFDCKKSARRHVCRPGSVMYPFSFRLRFLPGNFVWRTAALKMKRTGCNCKGLANALGHATH